MMDEWMRIAESGAVNEYRNFKSRQKIMRAFETRCLLSLACASCFEASIRHTRSWLGVGESAGVDFWKRGIP